MKKKTFFTWLYVVLIVVTVGFLVFMIFWLRGEGLGCIKDPISYHIKKTAQVCFCDDVSGWVSG